MSKPRVVIWSPTCPVPPLAGNKVNEIQRIRAISREFGVYAFLLLPLKFYIRRSTQVQDLSVGRNARVFFLPYIDVYGVRMIVITLLGGVVAFASLMLSIFCNVRLVLARGPDATFALSLLSRLGRFTLVYNVLSVPFGQGEGGLTRALMHLQELFITRNANYVGVASQEVANQISQVLGKSKEKLIVLPFPVSRVFYEHQADIRYETRRITLVYYGSIAEKLYDFRSLFEAIRTIREKHDNISLLIFTSRNDMLRLSRLVPSSVKQQVVFRPEMPADQLVVSLKKATALVVPIRKELRSGISLKSLEAMALGLPVIISNPRDSTIYRDGETCIVVSNDTPSAWEEAIRRATSTQLRQAIVNGAIEQSRGFRPENNARVVAALLNVR